MKKLLASAAVALLLVGCSDATGSHATTEVSAKATTQASHDAKKLRGEFDTVTELKDAAVKAGYACESWKETKWNQGTCSGKDFLGVFTNRGSRSASMHQTQAAGESFTALVGDNWYISGDESALKALEGKLNGKIEKVEGAAQKKETAN
ncbi:hypothetical protein CT171_09330 [Trueperella pyogenes]|uniref:hypothetical protein n=1 Tax=Trueperella pyogenes TaxID=1661 RepID=UPI000C1B776B|nr:hypothetical protein [Trueperella pyogenes]PIN50915.1 hypothetical protein CT171_09330 [Trueperella pyogenes]